MKRPNCTGTFSCGASMTPADRIARGCSDGHCRVRKTTGQHTNGGCKCDTRAVIAQLEAELARVALERNAVRDELRLECDAREAEKRAHARTQAELQQVRKENVAVCEQYDSAARSRNSLLIDNGALQAEAAALREAASDLLSHIVVYITPQAGGLFDMLCKALNSAVTGDAGRAIAERVLLLEAVAKAARAAMGNPYRGGADDELRAALAALDATK